MNAVAADTAEVRLGVGRAVKVRVRSRVTGQALGVNLFGRVLRGIEYLGYVAAPANVVRTGSVAAFATLVRGSSFRVEGRLPVRRFLPTAIDFLVTGLAGLSSHVLGGFRRWRRRGGRRCAGRLSRLRRSRRGRLT